VLEQTILKHVQEDQRKLFLSVFRRRELLCANNTLNDPNYVNGFSVTALRRKIFFESKPKMLKNLQLNIDPDIAFKFIEVCLKTERLEQFEKCYVATILDCLTRRQKEIFKQAQTNMKQKLRALNN